MESHTNAAAQECVARVVPTALCGVTYKCCCTKTCCESGADRSVWSHIQKRAARVVLNALCGVTYIYTNPAAQKRAVRVVLTALCGIAFNAAAIKRAA